MGTTKGALLCEGFNGLIEIVYKIESPVHVERCEELFRLPLQAKDLDLSSRSVKSPNE